MYQYKHDSTNKQKVREKWVEFIRIVKNNDSTPLSMITLPSSEFQELGYYAEEGLISAEAIEETGVFRITEGHIFCFEISSSRYVELQKRLAGTTALNNDVCSHLRTIRPRFLNGTKFKEFPLDAINLDFERSLCKLKIPISETIENLLLFQSKYDKQFAFFLTFPESEETDTEEYKEEIRSIIEANLSDDNNKKFINTFNEKYGNLDDIPYETLHVIGVIKKFIKESSFKNFRCTKFDYFSYGGVKIKGQHRKRMQSLLFIFTPEKYNLSHPSIYYDDVLNAFEDGTDLEE